MTSVERILEYHALPEETLNAAKNEIEHDWPKSGEIQFQNVSFKYEVESKDALKELCFNIYPNEKIGIVGRTGAGKSSIVQALFRMAEPSGEILIDRVNIKDLSLHDLRSRLSFIPVIKFTFFLTRELGSHTFTMIFFSKSRLYLKEQFEAI
jgi:ABC-type multidrug transport system fused ATPase/permease subunit